MEPTKEPQQPGTPAEDSSQSDTASTFRLVIRAEIIPEDEPAQPIETELDKRKLALVLVPIGVLAAIWVGIGALGTDSDSRPAVDQESRAVASRLPPPAPPSSKAEDVVGAEPSPPSTAPIAETESVAPNQPVHQAIPDVPRSALQTIRGTVRVSVRLTVDEQGTVVAATPDARGPSRYFERLALEASKKWTFAPVTTQQQRTVRVQFNFTRDGTTAHVNSQ